MPRAGTLDRMISIDYKVVTQDPQFGTEIITWARLTTQPIWSEWMDVLPSRSEATQGALQVARNQSRVRIRYRQGIDSTMRVVLHGDDGDVVHNIIGGPAEIGRKQWLELVCERASS